METGASMVRFPSDPLPPSGLTVHLAGRIEEVTENVVVLADAGGRALLDCVPGALGPGDLLVVAGAFRAGRFQVEAVVFHERREEPRGSGAWARFRWAGQGARLRARAAVIAAVRQWFDEQHFLEVHTPTWLSAPGLDSGVDAVRAEDGFLVTSPELHMKRLLVGGLPRLYQLATCFRREELGPRHQPEFTMLEWYRAFSELSVVLDDTESIVLRAANALGLGDSLDFSGRTFRLRPPFRRLSVEAAFRRYAGVDDVYTLAERSPDRYFELMVDRVEPGLSEWDEPVFLTRYPASQAALARICPDEPRAAERSELFLGGIELCNAYGELSDATEQRRRFEAELVARQATSRPVYPLDEAFLSALEEGLPPSAGNALGFDRLMQVLLNRSDIADTMAFPRQR
jgi:lysyl-tRNA synthetase class 2